MKQSITIGLFFVAFLLLPGCIFEDMDDCPPSDNVELVFTYEGDTGEPAMFGRMIDRVTLCVFDAAGDRVTTGSLDKEALTEFPGARLTLDPGQYRIVCWGNAFEQTEITGTERLSEGRISPPAFLTGNKILTGDHLYYGTYDLAVPSTGTVSGEIPFAGAHINLRVYIQYEQTAGSPGTWPFIEAENLMPQYDMEMQPTQPYATTYYPETGYDTERELNTAFFQTNRFGDDNPVRLVLKKSDGEIITTIGVKDYMAANAITVDGKHEATVPVLIEVTDLDVKISVPEWEISEVDPET